MYPNVILEVVKHNWKCVKGAIENWEARRNQSIRISERQRRKHGPPSEKPGENDSIRRVDFKMHVGIDIGSDGTC